MEHEARKDFGFSAAGATFAGLGGAWFGKGVGIAVGGTAISGTLPIALTAAAVAGLGVYTYRSLQRRRRGNTA